MLVRRGLRYGGAGKKGARRGMTKRKGDSIGGESKRKGDQDEDGIGIRNIWQRLEDRQRE